MSCGVDAKKFSFRRRTINHREPEYHMIKQDLPGPGNYGRDLGIGINKIGKYYVSNISNSRASVFSPSKRFKDNRSAMTQNPGPGTYTADDVSLTDDKVRTYVLSNFKTNGVSRMVMPYNTINGNRAADFSDRSIKSRLDTPGPGQYQLPSDFGHLDSFRDQSPRWAGNDVSLMGTVQPVRPKTNQSPRVKVVGRLHLSQMNAKHIDLNDFKTSSRQ